MRRWLLRTTMMLVLPGIASAQSTDPVAQELRRGQQNPSATPWVPEQNRNADDAYAAGIDDAARLIRAAPTALRANRRG